MKNRSGNSEEKITLEKFLYETDKTKISESIVGKSEEKISFGENENSKILFLYDLKIGTKMYSPKAMEGLYNILYEEKPEVIVFSGILPKVPSYFGKRLKEFLRAVDNDIPKKYDKKAWKEILNKRRKEAKTGIEDYDKSPIPRDLQELVIIAKYEIGKLFENLNYKPEKVIYLWSQDDWDNVEELAGIYFRKESTKKMEDLKKSKYEIIKKKKEIERKLKELEKEMDIKPDEYNELLKELDAIEDKEAEIISKIRYQKYRSMLKQWNIAAKDFQETIDKVKNKYISEFIKPIFSAYEEKTKIYPYNKIEIEYDGFGSLLISYNLNKIISKTPITSSIHRYQQLVRNLKSRTGKLPKMIIDGSMHKGGFRVLADNVDGAENVNVVYIVKLLAFAKWNEDLALKKAYAVDEEKRGMYDIDEGGVVLLDIYKNGKVRFRIVSTETLEYYQRYGYDRFKKYEIITAGDFHVGSRNDIKAPSNMEYMEMIGEEILKKNPDVVVLTGDLIDGMHSEGYKYADTDIIPSKEEKILKVIEEKQNGLRKKLEETKNNKTRGIIEQEIKELDILKRRVLQTRRIPNISLQREELIHRFLKPFMIKYLKKNRWGKLVLISGQHYNKVNFMTDEANDIKQLFLMVSKDISQRIYAIGGSEMGVGSITIDEIKFFFIHGPRVSKWSNKDPVYKLLEHANKGFPDSKIAICGELACTSYRSGERESCSCCSINATANKIW